MSTESPLWETYVDQLKNEGAAAAVPYQDVEVSELHANENVSKVVAYSSQYLFWVVMSGIAAGFLLLF